MVKVLHVWPSLDQGSGGPLRAILDLSAASARFGLHSELLGFGPIDLPDNPMDPRLIHCLPTGFPKSYFYVPRLRRWLFENLGVFDGVILHGLWLYPQSATAQVCRALGVPYACFAHGMLDGWSLDGQGAAKQLKKLLWWWLRDRWMYRGARASMFATRRELDSARDGFALSGRQLILAPFGIGPRTEVEEPSRNELMASPGSRTALFLGRVDPKKNVDFLIEAWARAGVPPEWQLCIAGPAEPDYRAALEALVDKNGLRGQVRFVGMVSGPDKSYLLQHADWFLLPSKQENFGIAVLEAIGSGCPVAISDRVNLAERFHAGSEVLPLKMDAWVDFLRHRMPDENWRQTLVAADRQQIVPQFRMESVARDWAGAIGALFRKVAA